MGIVSSVVDCFVFSCVLSVACSGRLRRFSIKYKATMNSKTQKKTVMIMKGPLNDFTELKYCAET